jgi:thiamine-phosphate diphosphorylase
MTRDNVALEAVADALAHAAHAGQRRRHGADYIDHPRAVTALATDLGAVVGLPLSSADRAASLLHDVIEDSAEHTEAVLREHVGLDVAQQVSLLTKVGKGDDVTTAYYARLHNASKTTRLIKVADRLHNLSELHKAHNDSKLVEYVHETQRFVRPLAASIGGAAAAGLVAALDDTIDLARRLGAAANGAPQHAPRRGLYAIVQPSSSWKERLDAVLRGGAVRVQLRVKPADGLTDRQWLAMVQQAKSLAAPFGVDVVVNDRPDIAFVAGVGAHVGDTDLPPPDVRRLLGDAALVGTSTHSVAQLLDVVTAGGADHVALGPIWASPTKQGHADVVGGEALRAACARSSVPVVAIGGITGPVRAAEAITAGATWACAVSAFASDDIDAVWLTARRFSVAMAAARGCRAAAAESEKD